MPEFDLIARIHARAATRGDVVLGIGDDAAILRVPSGHDLVVAMDTLNSGVHFPEDTAPADIGWKALAVNLSDLAAMAATPAWCTLALTLPDADDAWLLRVGVRVRGDLPTSQGLVQPYARVNLYSGKGGTDIARFIGPAAFTDIATATGGTRAELAVGASWHVSPTVSLYGEVGNLWDVGGAVRTDGGLNGSLGVKVRW